MPYDWLCTSCRTPIRAGDDAYVVLTFSWRPGEPDHLCGVCWSVMAATSKAGALLALEVGA